MITSRWLRPLFGLVLAVSLVGAACGDDDEATGSVSGTGTGSPAVDEGETDDGGAAVGADFELMEEGKLIVGTELPAPPFWNGDDYDNQPDGFEVDLARRIGEEVGVEEVEFVEMPFSGLVAGQRCPCDFDLSQVTITDERAQVVDFSDSYFDANQGVLVKAGTQVPDAAAAKKLRWGAQVNTTGLDYINDSVQPDSEAQVYNTTVDAFNALRAGQIDAVMLDVPIVAGEAARSGDFEVVGQYETGEAYGAVLAKDSPNTEVFNAILASLKEEGFLDELAKKYFPEAADVPVLG